MTLRVANVLFLCGRNSARSILAESALDLLGRGRFKGYSAGSHPKGLVDPQALELLTHLGFATGHLRSKSWAEFSAPDAPAMDYVFTVCDRTAREPSPIWPGRPITAHWKIPDPTVVDGSKIDRMLAFRQVFVMLDRRIRQFRALRFDELSRQAIEREVTAIGRVDDVAARPGTA